ncbi:MAG TPA: hypothetical protein VNO30_29515 [Kofleriaceae bacterium]|nr:hypothetical protein [Kofleriaceae bacterium]
MASREREVGGKTAWSPEFFARLRDVDDATSAAVDELVSHVRAARRSKKPPQLATFSAAARRTSR